MRINRSSYSGTRSYELNRLSTFLLAQGAIEELSISSKLSLPPRMRARARARPGVWIANNAKCSASRAYPDPSMMNNERRSVVNLHEHRASGAAGLAARQLRRISVSIRDSR
jgi:hypothetical protein